MSEIKKINENYYKISIEPFCSVFLDEYLMWKANRILSKYKQEIWALLEKNKEHIIKEEWALAYPNGEQVTFYGTNLLPPKQIFVQGFITKKVENLFYVGDKNIYSEEVKNTIEKILKKEEK